MRLALVIWCLLWAFVGFPWRSFRLRPSFRRVELIPFAGGLIRTHILNVLAFVPLGIIGARLGWQPRAVILVAMGVSGFTELLQLFSSRRFPSTADFILNTAGAVIGMCIGRAWENSRAKSS